MFGLWLFYFVRAEYDATAEFVARMRDIGKALGDPIFQITSEVVALADLTPLGKFGEARKRGLAALALHDPSQRERIRATFGMDTSVSGFDWIGLSLTLLGLPEQAMTHQNTALELAKELGGPNNLAMVLRTRR